MLSSKEYYIRNIFSSRVHPARAPGDGPQSFQSSTKSLDNCTTQVRAVHLDATPLSQDGATPVMGSHILLVCSFRFLVHCTAVKLLKVLS